jgi:hypothetical protein
LFEQIFSVYFLSFRRAVAARFGFHCRGSNRQIVIGRRNFKTPWLRQKKAGALAALEEARAMPSGPERTEALKKAGILQNVSRSAGSIVCKARETIENLVALPRRDGEALGRGQAIKLIGRVEATRRQGGDDHDCGQL